MKSTVKLRGGIYCRMSRSKGDHKIEAQEDMCRKLAEANGVAVVKVYVDDGISASLFKERPGWAQMLTDVAAGELDVLLAQSEDRFSRQPMEKEALVLACVAVGSTWLTVNEGKTDPATADGAFFSTMRAALGRLEGAHRVNRQRQASDAMARKGRPQAGGVRPFGWEADKVTLRPSEADELRKAVDVIMSGGTVHSIARDWNERGVRTAAPDDPAKDEADEGRHPNFRWTNSTVKQVLVRPRMAGLVKHRGQVLEGVVGEWEPIMDEASWHELVATLTSRRQTHSWEPKWLLSGLIKCSTCDGGMTSSHAGTRILNYRCRTGHGVDKVTGHMQVSMALADEVVTKAVVAGIVYAPTDATDDADTQTLGGLHQKIAEHRAATARLVEAVASGALSSQDVAGKRASIAADIVEAERAIAAIAARNAQAALVSEARRGVWSLKPSHDGAAATLVDLSLEQGSLHEDVAKVRAEVAAKFADLPLDQKRALVKAFVDVTVMPGRGPDRVKVIHLRALSLNEADAVV